MSNGRGTAGRGTTGSGDMGTETEREPSGGAELAAGPVARGSRGAPETGAAASVPKRVSAYPSAVDRLIAELAKLPGIGRRSAERLAFYLLKSDDATAMALAKAVEDVKRTVRHCGVCWSLCDGALCGICADPSRQREVVLVVEQPKDLLALEQTGMYKGLYHVLMGRLSPLEGIGADVLTISGLLERVADSSKNPGGVAIKEVVLGLNPTLEGDGTALYLGEALRGKRVAVTRLARGLPSGSQLEYANKAVLADAIVGRRRVETGDGA